RSLRMRQKQLDQVYGSLEAQLGREPTDDELAEKMGVSAEEVREMFRKSQTLGLISLDEYLEQNNEPVLPQEHTGTGNNPEKMFSKREIKDILTQAIQKLSKNEQIVLSLYYFDELTQKEISMSINVSESRVSQIHSKALFKLSRLLGRHKSILFDT
ncbi:MAG: sigma-70 family RNA polymerase sigma factor, partial [Defluviitaleaceae bacterium]|nr:sigma-70 family RNA polymerase sigma factor [Defluviitaleaceae bacterium]